MPKTAKKELKTFINENGFFFHVDVDVTKNAPSNFANSIPEGATYFEGVVSNGELNRNGYKIRPQALMESLASYMENPVILLQHDTDQPIGHCLSAGLVGGEVVVSGYIFDSYTDGRFSKGLFRGLSTGHIPHEVEFENSKTGQVITEEEFMKYDWEERYFGDWIMCVTKLDWVEFSLVGIGSVKKALITATNAIGAYLENNGKISENIVRDYIKSKKNNNTENEEKGEEETKNESNTQPNEGTEKTGETPESTEKTDEKSGEVVEESKEEKVEEEGEKVEGNEEDKPASASENPESAETSKEDNKTITPQILSAIQALVDQNKLLNAEVTRLKNELSKIPNRKGLSINSQFRNEAPRKQELSASAQAVVNMFRDAGAKI